MVYIKRLIDQQRLLALAGRLGVFVLLCVFLAACTAPLDVAYKPKQSPHPAAKGVKVIVSQFVDKRAEKDPRKIGKVGSVVTDMYGTELVMSEDASSLVTRAFAAELSSAGFMVFSGEMANKANADLIIGGEIKEFKYDIGSRDEITIELLVNVTDRDGKVIWSGTEVEKANRFAGVVGNSRGTISGYLVESLSKAVRKTLYDAGPAIPQLRQGTAQTAPAFTAPDIATAAPAQGGGKISITSVPPRAKVYLNDVYFGLTPITLEIEPGVYEMTVRQKGFKENRERVSVRPRQLTEVELNLDKE